MCHNVNNHDNYDNNNDSVYGNADYVRNRDSGEHCSCKFTGYFLQSQRLVLIASAFGSKETDKKCGHTCPIARDFLWLYSFITKPFNNI